MYKAIVFIFVIYYSSMAIHVVNGREIPGSTDYSAYGASIQNCAKHIDTLLSELAGILTSTEGEDAISVDSVSAGRMVLSQTVFDDVRVPANNFRINPAQTKPDLTALSNGFPAYMFDATDAESVWCYVQLPHGRKAGTDICPHVHWAPSTTDQGNVVWVLSYSIADVGGTLSTVTHDTVASVEVNNNQYKHIVTGFTDIDGSSLTKVSAMIAFRIKRLPGHTSDDYGADAALLEFDCHIEKDKIGSATESSY